MNQKLDKKKYLRPKSNEHIMEISEPFAFKHDLHIGFENYDQRHVDTAFVFPKISCPETTGVESFTNSSLTQAIKNDVMPAIRSEIADIVEERLRYILNEHSGDSFNRHCSTCLCTDNKAISEKDVHIIMKKDMKFDEMHNRPDSTQRKGDVSSEQGQEGLKTEYKNTSSRNHVKYSSDILLAEHVNLEKEEHLGFIRTQTLPVSANMLSKGHSVMRYRKGRPFSEFDERKCLADALQWHVEEFIDGIVFKDSELPDDLLGDSCLTDEECASIRTTLDRKNQVRVLISIIKGRDLKVLQRFLKHIKTQNESLAKSIVEKFELNKSNGVRCSECALCLLTSNVNLKYIADRLWKYNLIDGGLYNWIIQFDKPTGVQGELWRGVISSLNVHCKKNRSDVCAILSAALTKNNHYVHIAKGLERMISTYGELACHCQVRPNVNFIQSAESLLSLQSSRSPKSSEVDINPTSEAIVSHFDQTSDNNLASDDFTGIFPQQNQQGPKEQTDDMNQTKSQDQVTTDQDTAYTGETNIISPRHSSHTDVNQENDNFVLENSIDSFKKQEDEFPNFTSVTSNIPPEDNYIIVKKSSVTMSNNAHGDTNVSLRKDENSKIAVSERNRKVYTTQGRQFLIIFDNELESSDV